MRLVRISTLAALALLAALLAGCATGPDTRVDRDPSADMKSYKTFGFFRPLATDRGQYSSLISEHLMQATRAQLEKHGYVYSDANPDLRVNFYLNVMDRTAVRSTPAAGRGFYGYRVGYAGWAGYPYNIETENYRQGTLSIDLVDVRKRSLVWQGVAEGRVSKSATKNPGAAAEAAVNEIFANFPNGAAK